MDKSLLVPKTVNWSKPTAKDVLTSQDLLKAADNFIKAESQRAIIWQNHLKKYADYLDQKVRDSFKRT